MKALLIVEQSWPIALHDELERLIEDITEDGFRVGLMFVKAPAQSPSKDHRHIEIAESIIWPWLKLNPGGHVLLIGNVPVPFSGTSISLNEIKNDQGALPALSYYVTPGSSLWTDTRTRAEQRRNDPGDGQFDQNVPGAPPIGSIGQINFTFVRGQIGFTTTTNDDKTAQIEAYRRYFNLNRDYRKNGWKFGLDFGATNYVQGKKWQFIDDWMVSRPDLRTKWYWPKNKPELISDALNQGPFVVLGDFKLHSDTALAFWRDKAPKPWAFLSQFWGSGQGASDAPRLKYPLSFGSALVSMTWRDNLMPSFPYSHLFAGGTVGDAWLHCMKQAPVTWAGLLGDPTLRLKRKSA